MEHYFDIAFSPEVADLQVQKGSQQHYRQAHDQWPQPTQLGPDEIVHITARDSLYIASSSSTGWPYVQHRGGDIGFVKVLGPTTIGWLERNGNRQYVGTGNITANDRVALIMVDYPNRTRLKLYGYATYHPDPAPGTIDLLDGTGVRNDGAIVIDVIASDWNCPKYITQRFTANDVQAATEPLHERIAQLEAQLTRT